MGKKTDKPLAVLVLAAGKGTRMKSDLPKVMHSLAGLPMINWLLQTVEALNPEKVVVVTGAKMPELQAAVAPHETAIQQVRNGTAGAVKAGMGALEGFKGNILILLGDTPLVSQDTLQSLIAAKNEKSDYGLAVLGVELNNPKGYGRLIQNKNGTLRNIAEETEASAQEKQIRLVNTGAFCVEAAQLSNWLERIDNNNAQKEFYITDLPHIAAQDGFKTNVCITYNAAEVQGCNTRTDLSELEAEAQKILRSRIMDNGVHMFDPNTVYLQHDTIIEPGTLIEPNLFCGPKVKIGKNCHIKAFCHFEDATVKEGVTIGPYARLRPGTTLEEEVRIGNFVEIKKSTIGARSKVSHLGYVGDCMMGEDVNFSAGAITVNYDGFEKHQTTIGKGVMVGSNVNLIAPISIDDGAFIAAGSTITEDVPTDALSIVRDPAEIREGWAAEFRRRKAAIAKKFVKDKQTS